MNPILKLESSELCSLDLAKTKRIADVLATELDKGKPDVAFARMVFFDSSELWLFPEFEMIKLGQAEIEFSRIGLHEGSNRVYAVPGRGPLGWVTVEPIAHQVRGMTIHDVAVRSEEEVFVPYNETMGSVDEDNSVSILIDSTIELFLSDGRVLVVRNPPGRAFLELTRRDQVTAHTDPFA